MKILSNASEASAEVKSLLEVETEIFSDLVVLANLDPQHDLEGANLSGADFAGSDVRGFNFAGADLRRVNWTGAKFDVSTNVRGALLGLGDANVFASDLKELRQESINGSIWPVRFFAFKIIVDNFGVSKEAFDSIKHVFFSDKSSLCRLAAAVYFAATLLQQDNIRSECITIVERYRAPGAGFRTQKLRRFGEDLRRYLAARSVRSVFPQIVSLNEVGTTLDSVLNTGNRP